MSTSKHFNRICAVVMVLCLAVTLMLCFPDAVGIQAAPKTLGYESRLFDTSYVHSIDIVMDDWDSFLERNYNSTGNLYKPDSMSMGGGRGNGKDFDQDDFDLSKSDKFNTENSGKNDTSDSTETSSKTNFQPSQMGNFGGGKGNNGGFGGMGSDDVKLIYNDDDFDSYENIFDSAKTDITDSDKARLINSLKVLNSDDASSAVDVDAVIKYFAVHNFVCNFDSYTGSMIHNYYLYEKDGILSMIPWDYNLAFGGFVGGSDSTSMINYPIDSPVSGGDTDSRPMLAWIFADEEYTELYHEALSEFIANYFESGYFGEEIDRVTALISPYVEKDPTKFCTYDEFTEGAAALKEFCTLRAESVRGQLDGTIPSTSDAQTEDSSALISGSSVNISAMGSMNGGGMGGGMQNGGFGTPPNGNFGDLNGTPPEMPNSDNSDGQIPSFDGEPPELPSSEASPTEPSGKTSEDASSDRQTDESNEQNSGNAFPSPDQNGNNGQNRPQMPSDGGSPASASSSNTKTVVLLCISAGALIAAILLTRIFKDRI